MDQVPDEVSQAALEVGRVPFYGVPQFTWPDEVSQAQLMSEYS
jgi:hypothetical protein